MHGAPAALMEVGWAQAGLVRVTPAARERRRGVPQAPRLRGDPPLLRIPARGSGGNLFSTEKWISFSSVSLCCTFKADGGGTKPRIQRDSGLKRGAREARV